MSNQAPPTNNVPTQQPPVLTQTTTPGAFATGSLYVGDIHPEVTEANLFDIFNRIGMVASIRVCRDAITHRSLGYAYVNFHSVSDAEKALDQLNGASIKGRPCRIMWSQRDPAVRKSGKGNVFIKNLAKDIDHKALFDTFSQFGNILSCKIELDENGESKGYGFIQYTTFDAAEAAIKKIDGKMLNNKQVYVGPFVPKRERVRANQEKSFTNVFVKNLDESVTEEELEGHFSSYGPIKNCVIMREGEKKNKGFGFVNFENPEDAMTAVEELNNTTFRGKQIWVGRAQKKQERETELKLKFEQYKNSKYQGVNLYVKNLDDDIDDDKLRQVFAIFGSITSCKVMRDQKGNSRGFGFVCFNTPEEATKSVLEMHGKIVGSKPLYVAIAQRKELRKQQLEAQFAHRAKMIPRMTTSIYPPPNVFYPGFAYPPPMIPSRGGRFQTPYPLQPNFVMMPTRGKPMPRGGMQQPSAQNNARRKFENPESDLANMKNSLGEKLFPLISKSQPTLAPKITGMILDSCEVEEIANLISDEEALKQKIGEALTALKS